MKYLTSQSENEWELSHLSSIGSNCFSQIGCLLTIVAEFPLNVPPNFLASCTSRKADFEPTGVGETDDEKGNFHWYTMAVKPEDYLP